MMGVIAGDVIGSVHERAGTKSTDFPLFVPLSRFTDDTVLTVATAFAVLNGGIYEQAYRDFARRYPDAGYGARFGSWFRAATQRPYGSWGNGAAMRVAPVGLAFDDVDTVLREAERSASVTHSHDEGVRGAQATALAVFLARTGATKAQIRDGVARHSRYDLGRSLAEIRPAYAFDITCQGSVPEAIIAFLESRDVEEAIRLAISLGGDADTQAAIAGGIAEAFYGPLPAAIERQVRARLPAGLLEVVDQFARAYPPRRLPRDR